ncbi:pentatricopeptide repeat-containing protein At3g63370, chloroplastic [Beta vulgaris subsp. vulgaris]|uniref:pentatricopeptide repeat-containing protein At3g63370, chloroplastic n=1 Tax=Beta vulgaris subsp. vulgaris TaxID=3555 RepID=UPI002036B632|nr:pentatricopeptide repeat-containing protein At3g63370, chloroplastic [Beta vulgaris subsp. vulgaris]
MLRHSLKSNLMASSIQPYHLNSSSCLTTLPNYQMFKTTHFNFPIKSSKLETKPINGRSLKEICKQGNLKEAFQSLTQYLSQQNVTQFSPDEAYSSVLELCAEKKALLEGKQIHAHVITSNGHGNLVFLRTKLVFLYGKCGEVLDAYKVFDEMPQRSIFSWNAMLGAYVSNGKPWEALELYREMRVLGVNVDACTFPCVLKACGLIKDLKLGTEIHGFAFKSGCDSNGFVVNALVSMYAKCENTVGARQLFDIIQEREDVVLWNSIISAYSASGKPVEALALFREMEKDGVSMNSYTYVCALQACEEPFRRLGMEIHASILKKNNHMHLYVANALLVMYTRCGRMREAAHIFKRMTEKDSISWNSMLSGLVQNGFYTEALQFFHETLAAGQRADQVSLISILGASGRLKYLMNGMEVHAYAVKNGLDVDIQVANSLIDMYSKCCHTTFMECVFRSMPSRDVISWTTVIAGYAQNYYHTKALDVFREVQVEGVEIDAMMIGSVLLACTSLRRLNHVKETHSYILRNGHFDLVLSNTLVDAYGECNNIESASRLFGLIENKDVVSWTSMISAYVDSGLRNEALSLFRSMREDKLKPDFVALISILSATASLSALKIGKEVHGFLIKQRFLLEGSVASSLVDMYARCGTLENAFKVFNVVNHKDTVLWTCMIHASGMHGRGKEATELFDKMVMEDTQPDHVTFLALLYACSHSGMIDEGKKYIEIMKHNYSLEPWPEHYACMVDLLGRANRLKEAYQFVISMPIEPNAVVWCALLGACHVHSNNKLGDIAAEKLLNSEPGNPGNYVLVSNVFAAAGRWDDVELIRGRMKERGLKKDPACSWIEIRGKVHNFMARDKNHPQTRQIYEKLDEIIEILNKEGGYIAQTKYVLHNVDEEEKIRMLYGHSERLAIAYALLESPKGAPIRVTKNLRVCGDCHVFIKLVSKFFHREIIIRDASRFHHFHQGSCSCQDFW